VKAAQLKREAPETSAVAKMVEEEIQILKNITVRVRQHKSY